MTHRTPPTAASFSDPALWTEMFIARGELMRGLKATGRARLKKGPFVAEVWAEDGAYRWELRDVRAAALVLESGTAIIWHNACHDLAVVLISALARESGATPRG